MVNICAVAIYGDVIVAQFTMIWFQVPLCFYYFNPQSAEFLKFTSYCSLKPLWSGMGEVVPARTSPTLHPPSPPTVHQLS